MALAELAGRPRGRSSRLLTRGATGRPVAGRIVGHARRRRRAGDERRPSHVPRRPPRPRRPTDSTERRGGGAMTPHRHASRSRRARRRRAAHRLAHRLRHRRGHLGPAHRRPSAAPCPAPARRRSPRRSWTPHRRRAAAPGAEGDTLRDAAYTGDALTAAKADAKLAGTLTQDQKDALALTPGRAGGARRVQRPELPEVDGRPDHARRSPACPVLSLLVTPDVRTPFKIAASAPMLPATEVPAFDQVTQGAPSLGDDAAGLAVEPAKLAGDVCGLARLPGGRCVR